MLMSKPEFIPTGLNFWYNEIGLPGLD